MNSAYFKALEKVSEKALIVQMEKLKGKHDEFNYFLCWHIFYAAKQGRHSLLKRFLTDANEYRKQTGEGEDVHRALHFKKLGDTNFDKTALRWAVENEDR